MGQSRSSIAYFWKSSKDPIDKTDCYDDDTQETKRMVHNSGCEQMQIAGREFNDEEANYLLTPI